MTLTRYRLGDLVEKYDKKCNIPDLTVNDISGINRDKAVSYTHLTLPTTERV